jgi:hypothetical protein
VGIIKKQEVLWNNFLKNKNNLNFLKNILKLKNKHALILIWKLLQEKK